MKMALVSQVEWCLYPSDKWTHSFPESLSSFELGHLTHGKLGLDYIQDGYPFRSIPQFFIRSANSEKIDDCSEHTLCELATTNGSIEPMELMWRASQENGLKARVHFELEDIFTNDVNPTSYRCWGDKHKVKCAVVGGRAGYVWPSVLYALKLWDRQDAPRLWIDCLSMHLAGHNFTQAVDTYLRSLYCERPDVYTESAIWLYSPWRLREYVRRGWAFQEIQLSNLSNRTIENLSKEMCKWALEDYEWRPQMESVYENKNRDAEKDRHLVVHFVREALSGIGATNGIEQVTPVIETIRSDHPDELLVKELLKEVLATNHLGNKRTTSSLGKIDKGLMKRNYLAATFLNEIDRIPAIFGTFELPNWFDEVYCDIGPRLTIAPNLTIGSCGKLDDVLYDTYPVLENGVFGGFGVWLSKPHKNQAAGGKLSRTIGICKIDETSQVEGKYGKAVGIVEVLEASIVKEKVSNESFNIEEYILPEKGDTLSKSISELYRQCLGAINNINARAVRKQSDSERETSNYTNLVLKYADSPLLRLQLDCQ